MQAQRSPGARFAVVPINRTSSIFQDSLMRQNSVDYQWKRHVAGLIG